MSDKSHDSDLLGVEGLYQQMLTELRDEHGDEIDAHIRDLVRDAIHESYKELDAN
jgi:hypothetical protein